MNFKEIYHVDYSHNGHSINQVHQKMLTICQLSPFWNDGTIKLAVFLSDDESL